MCMLLLVVILLLNQKRSINITKFIKLIFFTNNNKKIMKSHTSLINNLNIPVDNISNIEDVEQDIEHFPA